MNVLGRRLRWKNGEIIRGKRIAKDLPFEDLPIHSNTIGKIAPKHMLLKTIRPKAVVTATASGKAVLKMIALKNPATLNIVDNAAAIFISLVRNWFLVRSLRVPKASPLMTRTLVLTYVRKEGERYENILKKRMSFKLPCLVSRITACADEHG